MDDDQAEIVAAAAGQIIEKRDGNYDRNCDFSNGGWNAVYVRHADGSIAWYGHMKSGSLTNKAIGDTVEQGEYLGIIGSSGYSTGPHLHFELYDGNGTLIDPYAGNCNTINTNSWWEIQKPYTNPNVNTVLTHSAPPQFPGCPNTEIPNTATKFGYNETIYLATYLRDQYNGSTMNLSVKAPNGSIINSWNKIFNNNYYGSYWWWTLNLDEGNSIGDYIFEAVYENEEVSTLFSLVDCSYDTLYMVGYGIMDNGWSWENNVASIDCIGNNVISGSVHLNASGDANFRFFTSQGDWTSGLNYPYFDNLGYTIDERLVNANDNDSNFKFIGDSGVYSLSVDLDLKSITLESTLDAIELKSLRLGLENNPIIEVIKLNPSEPLKSYKLYNISGQIVMSGLFDKNHTIDAKHLDKGMYLLEAFTFNNITTKPIRLLK